MEKPILYCDCDGVILNTIEIAFKIMKKNGIDINNRLVVDEFFKKSIDWNELFEHTTPINDSINTLRKLKESDYFQDVFILTKLSGGYDEERLKRNLFQNQVPNIKVITLQYGLAKSLVVPVKNNILVDDEIGNCISWLKEGGMALLFSRDKTDYANNVINDLCEIVNTNGYKKMIKTRYF